MSDFSRELEGEQKRISSGNISINYSDKKFYERFINEYNVSDKRPSELGSDAEFITVQQTKKLKSMGIEMSESITAMPFSEVTGNVFSDEKYILKRLSQSLYRKANFSHKNGKKYELKQNIYADADILYAQPNKISDNEELNCPHCGKISKLRQLEQGCEKCNNSSFITGIFPNVKALFYRKNNSVTVRDIGKTLFIFSFIGMLVGIPFGISGFISDISGIFTKNTIYDAIANVFKAPLKGVMVGIIISVIYLLVKVIHDSIKNSNIISKTNELKRKIALSISEYEKRFCFENFESKVISLIKLVIYCDDRAGLVNCELKNPVRAFDIADSTYLGFMELKKINIEYDICNIILDVYMSDIYFDGKKFLKKDDIFTVSLSKRMTKKSDIGFELSNVTCPVCFEHYNAFETTDCSFCASRYKPDAKDWVITDLKIK